MTYRIRIPSKSIPTDEAHLLSGLERVGFTLQQRSRQILVVLGVLVIVVMIVGVVVWLDHRNAQQAVELEQQATQLYLDRPVDKPQQADQNLKQAITLYRQLLDQYPRSSSAPLALFQLGNALVQANDIAGAIEAYQKYVAMYNENKPLLGMVLQRLGYAYLIKDDREAATKVFVAATDMPGTLNKDQVLYELGKIEEAQSRPEGALAHYQDLTKTYPTSPFAGEATVRAKALEMKASTSAPAGATGTASQGVSTETKK
ncbi:MAG: tetratricopeptide repeat protein [Nitrospirales bacterium]|nr:tetratricopeptide repeat protein [Nitrospirales bacterium]